MGLPYLRLLVTGGCGFIGSNLVRLLLHLWSDARVVNLDALTYAGNPENVADLQQHPRYRFVHGRVEDAALVARLLAEERIQAVVHLAAESHVDRSIRDPLAFITTNVVGTQSVLAAARQANVQRVLYASTDEVYGPAGEGQVFDEDAPLRPSSPYAASKAAGELLAAAYGRTYGLEVVITRASNTYGPYQLPEKLLPLAILNALDKIPIPIYGDGQQERDWLHVEDHCRALAEVLLRGQRGAIYNIATAALRTNLHLVHAVLDRLGESHARVQHVADRPGHDRRYAISADRLAAELGWRPSRSLDDGIDETVDWYRSHAGWCRRVREGVYRDYYREQYGRDLPTHDDELG